jgi:hypothetical protein
MINRSVRVDPSLLDGPIMDRSGITYVRLLVKPQKAKDGVKVFELSLTDRSGKRKREKLELAIFYDGNIVVAATFILRISLEYANVEDAKVEVIYEPSTRRARMRFAVANGSIDCRSEVRGPEVGRTPEYDEFLEAPPDEQREVKVSADGTLELPPAPEAS